MPPVKNMRLPPIFCLGGKFTAVSGKLGPSCWKILFYKTKSGEDDCAQRIILFGREVHSCQRCVWLGKMIALKGLFCFNMVLQFCCSMTKSGEDAWGFTRQSCAW
ncbi:hypothetical protein U1Q18_031377 [Sarracenia purpurea var. burkii]